MIATYPGGKNGAGVYQVIINQIPPHDVYIEPFLGSAAVMRRMRSPTVTIGVDRSGVLASGVPDRFVRGCGIEFLESYLWTGREFVYCDPPYLRSVRRSQRPIYRHELSAGDHRRLLRCLIRIPAAVMVSGYWSKLYEKRLDGWRSVTYRARTRGGTATEWLWMNYPEPVALHDYRFLGANYRERERIKKKVARWRAKAAALDVLERRAILSALIELEAPETVVPAGPTTTGGNGAARGTPVPPGMVVSAGVPAPTTGDGERIPHGA